MLFDWVFDVMRQCFQFVYDVLTKTEFKEGITMWSLLIVFIFGGSLIRVVLSSIGGTGLIMGGTESLDEFSRRKVKNPTSADLFLAEADKPHLKYNSIDGMRLGSTSKSVENLFPKLE